jgi:T-complex protein 1 subunit theta
MCCAFLPSLYNTKLFCEVPVTTPSSIVQYSMSSMAYNSAAGLGGMLRNGSRHYTQGDDPSSGSVVLRNVDACVQISRMLLTSLGPQGRCKLVINHLGKLSVTSDCATILKNLDIEHPAAQLLVSAVTKQEEICGDNTNYVLAIGGELLYQTAKLIGKMSWQPANEILAGYQRALQLIQDQYMATQIVTSYPIDVMNREHLLTILKPVLASKQYGSEQVLAPLVADACLAVMNSNRTSFAVEAIRTVKILGAPITQSSLLPGGYVALRSVDSVCQSITNDNTTCRIAVFACSIEASTTEAKGTVVMNNAHDLLLYNHTEEQKMSDIIESIVAVGINVIVTGGNVSDVALHFIDRHNLLLLKMGSKWELRRLCQAIHATALVRLGPPTPEEIGYCTSVRQEEMGGKPVTVFRNDPTTTTTTTKDEMKLATIILRASTGTVLADLERAVDDGVQAIAQVMKDQRMVYGGGAIEMALSVLLQNEASKTPGLSQYAIAAFGKALEIIPHTLAENAGSDPTQVLANLQAAHTATFRTATTTTTAKPPTTTICDMGVDIDVINEIKSMEQSHTYDLVATKMSALHLAVDAVITILKIDQIIMSKPAGAGPK